MSWIILGKEYGKRSDGLTAVCTLTEDFDGSESVVSKEKYANKGGTGVYCFQEISLPQVCAVCDRKIRVGENTARPHYPNSNPHLSGPPELIQNDERTVCSGIYVCSNCYNNACQEAGLNYRI